MWKTAPVRPIELEQTVRGVQRVTLLTHHLPESLPSVLDVSVATGRLHATPCLVCVVTVLVTQWALTVNSV